MSDSVGQGLGGAARLMLGDPGGAGLLDDTPAAMRFSLIGLALMLAIDAGVWVAMEGRGDSIIGEVIVSLVSYAAMMGVVVLFARDADTRLRLPLFLVAQNWAMAVLSAVTLPIALMLVRLAVSPDTVAIAMMLWLAILVIAFTAWMRVVRITLDQPPGRAAIITASSFVAQYVALGLMAPASS